MRKETILENVETYLMDLILKGGERTTFDKILRSFLYLLSRLYFTIVKWRISLYRHRFFKDHRLGCLVISIGNLTVGGTGKTPVVEVFSRILSERNRKVAILSRGYKSKGRPLKDRFLDTLLMRADDVPPRIVCDGDEVLLDSLMAGDEPFMLARNLENVVVLVDKDRVKAGKYAIRRFGCDTLIMDDGFQYLPLKPRLNILLIDATNPFTNHHLLPLGLLREPIHNLARADYIFLTKSNGGSHLRHLKSFIKKHNSTAEIIECCHKPLYLQEIRSGKRLPLDLLKNKKVASISGIAKPKSFEAFLRGFGSDLVYVERFADHHRFTGSEIRSFVKKSKDAGAELLLTTEKDAVRFPEFSDPDLPMLFMRVEINIISGHESFEQCIARICFSSMPHRDPLEELDTGAMDSAYY